MTDAPAPQLPHPPHDFHHHPHRRRGYFYAALAVLIWSGFIIVSRLGGESALSTYDIIALRYGVTALILLPFLLVRHRFLHLFERRRLPLVLSGGLFYALCVFHGFHFSSATHAAILLPGMIPFAVVLMAYFALGEHISRHQWAGLALIVVGLLALATETIQSTPLTMLGDVLFVLGAVSWGVYTVQIKRLALTPLEIVGTLTFVTLAIYLPLYLLALPKHIATAPWQDIVLQAFYQGVLANCVQMFLYIRAVHILGASRMGMIMALVPAIAALAASPILGEPLTTAILGGLVLVGLGVALSQKKLPHLLSHPHASQ
ncbi:MAG: DMT family transporter [Alphaproteobacteria bacterium]